MFVINNICMEVGEHETFRYIGYNKDSILMNVDFGQCYILIRPKLYCKKIKENCFSKLFLFTLFYDSKVCDENCIYCL